MGTLVFACGGMESGGEFPIENTGRGQDISPEIFIEDVSPGAKTLAVTLEDISHPLFRNFTHWLIWNIPAGAKIPGAIPKGKHVPGLGNARQGLGYGVYRYAGPKPPKGKRHLYRLTVYVLDSEVDLKFPATKSRFLAIARKHIVQQSSITCGFGSQPL